MSCDSTIYRQCTCNLGQTNCGFKREYHREEINPCGRGHCYNSQGTHKDSQRCIYDSRNILRKWNTVFIFLSRKIILTAVINLSDRKSITIFKSFKELEMYDLKCGFRITTLHVDSKFAPTQELIHEITGWGIVNIASDSENVSEIERQIRAEK